MKEKKQLLRLVLSFLKIGAFTFGGGYAMIALFRDEFVERKKWISEEEFLDMVAIAESTPGPIAINGATYIGYRVYGVLGSALATLSVCLPAFTIIYLISLFFDAFLSLEYVTYAFRGIQVCVSYLILSAGVRMVKGLKKTVLNIVLLSASALAMILCTLFAVRFSTIFYILLGGAVGVLVYLVSLACKRGGKDE